MKNVVDFVDEKKTVQNLVELIRIPSLSGDEFEKALYLEKKMQDLGLEVTRPHEVRYDSPSIIGILHGQGGGKNLLWTAHLDTYSPYVGQKAWCGDVREGAVWGCGAGDSMSPLAAFLGALDAIKRSETKLKGDIIFVTPSDEMIGSRGMQLCIDWMKENRIKPDMCLIGEPTGLTIDVAHHAIVEFEVETKGVGGNPFDPHTVNAVEEMMKIIAALRKMSLTEKAFKVEHPLLGRAPLYIGPIEGGAGPCGPSTMESEVVPLELGKRSFQSFSSWSKHTNGVAYRCPEYCRLRFGVRPLPAQRRDGERWTIKPAEGQTTEELFKLIDKTIKKVQESDPKLKYQLRLIQDRNLPDDVSPSEAIVRILEETVEEILGKRPKVGGGKHWIEGSMFIEQFGIPATEIGPASPDTQERCMIKDLVATAKIYALSAVKICGLAQQ